MSSLNLNDLFWVALIDLDVHKFQHYKT